MARFALQNVPMARLGWSTLFDKWSFSGITKAFDEPGFRSSLWLSVKLAVGTVILTLALLLPTTLWVHLRIPKARTFVEFLTVLPVRHPTDRAGRRDPADQAARSVVPQLRLLADPVLHRARASVHVPGDRRRRPGDRRQDARRRLAQPRRRLGHHAAAGPDPEPADRDHLVVVPHRRRRAGRVHRRQGAAEADAAAVHVSSTGGTSRRAAWGSASWHSWPPPRCSRCSACSPASGARHAPATTVF